MPKFVRNLLRCLAVLAVIGLAVVLLAYRSAVQDPVVRRTDVVVPRLRGGPITIALLSDTHVIGPDMPPERLIRIVGQINALHPDIIAVTGDLISDKRFSTRRYSTAASIAPLGGLRAPLGVYAVLGNHDHGRGPAGRNALESERLLRQAGITVLDNDAAQVGPIAIGGLDDAATGHADPVRTLMRLDALPGPKVMLTHSPDPFLDMPENVVLTLAGHTHCGQIRLPLIGAIATMTRHGRHYACGRVDEGRRTLIVTAGVGTSIVPLRIGAPPDFWLVRLVPPPVRGVR